MQQSPRAAVVGCVFQVRVVKKVVFLVPHRCLAADHHKAVAAFHAAHLVRGHQLAPRDLIAVAGRAVAALADALPLGADGLLAQQLGNVLKGAVIVAAKVNKTVAVADDRFPVVLVFAFDLGNILQNDIAAYVAAARNGKDLYKVLRRGDIGKLVHHQAYMNRQCAVEFRRGIRKAKQLVKQLGVQNRNHKVKGIRPYDMVKLYPTTTFSEACNIGDGYYKDENGQFQWAPADTRTLDALKKYQDLYQEGILDSEFYSYTRYQGAQKFYVQGTSGLTLEDGHAIMITYIRNGLAEQGLDPDKVLHLAQLVGDDGMYHYREDSNYWGQVMFSPTISQEKFERAMDILDYTCTEEGQNFMNMGFEGIDWKLDENGNYVSLLDPSIQGSATSVLGGKYPSKESSFGGLILPDDFSLVSPNYSHEIQDTVRGFYKLREELSDTTTLLPREYEYEFLSSREKSQATMDLGDEYAKLILKDGELEDNWNTWVEEKMAVVQPVLDQLNK